MAKNPKPKKKGKVPAVAKGTSPKLDQAAVEKLVESTFGGKVVLASAEVPNRPAVSETDRKNQIMRSFFGGVKFDQLEEDVEQMRELHTIVNRRGDDDASGAVGRVVELLESLLDTGETCGFNAN